MLPNVYHSCSANAGTFFSKKTSLTFTQVCRRLCMKLCRRKVPVDSLQELPTEMIRQFCLSWLRMRVPRIEAAEGTPELPLDKPFLICLPAERTGFRLGCCTARGQKSAQYPRPDQQCQPPAMVCPCQRELGLVVHESSPSGSILWEQLPSASDGQGHQQGHVLLLSTTQGHCPPQMLMDWNASWDTRPLIVPEKCFRFQLASATHQLLLRHNAALCACLQQHLGNAPIGTGPEHEMKGLC